MLLRFIRDANRAIGKDEEDGEAPWDIIAEKMGGTRNRTQCRKKWSASFFLSEGISSDASADRHDELRNIELNGQEKARFNSSDRPLLVQR